MARKGDDQRAGGGLLETAIPLLVVTVIGGAGGGFLGYAQLTPSTGGTEKSEPAAAAAHRDSADAHNAGHGAENPPKATADLQLKELPSIVTNLAGSSKTFVQLQSAVLYDPREIPHVERLLAELTSDVTAFLRTQEISSLEGAEGLRRLQEELSERAAIRADGKVRQFIIETLVVQ